MLTALTMSPIPGIASGDDRPGTRSGAVGEPEERHAVAVARVEEEVLSHAARQIEGFDQRHAKDIAVKVDGRSMSEQTNATWLMPPSSNSELGLSGLITSRLRTKLVAKNAI